MKRAGQSQEELALSLGVRQGTVSDWVNDKYLPSGEILVQLPGLLRVDGHWLLTGTPEPPPPGPAQQAMDLIRRLTELAYDDPDQLQRIAESVALKQIEREDEAAGGGPQLPG